MSLPSKVSGGLEWPSRYGADAPGGRIVNVSSSLGSLARTADKSNPYRSASNAVYAPPKTVLNAITLATPLSWKEPPSRSPPPAPASPPQT
jgi:NAD(P)-dependent dehydrogenase (short-subunit alcohol dehydrogenase family)